jgi:hypothetical protein
MNRIFLFLIVVSIVVSSCHQKHTDVGPTVLGLDYYPLDSGRFWVYSIHQTIFNSVTTDTTFQMKEVIYDTMHFANNIIYQLYRFYRSDSTVPWPAQPDSVWTLTSNNYELDIKENDVEFVRLAFPLSNNQTWNGNARNIGNAQQYSIINFGTSFSDTISSSLINTYAQTCTVQEANNSSIVGVDSRKRIYAKGIGLVYRKYTTLNYDTQQGNIGQFIITFSNITEQKLLDYGKP